jgi:hypothetical protein
MKLSMPTSEQTNSVLGHVYSVAATATAVAIFFGVEPNAAHQLAPAIQKIGEGVSSIIAGVTMLIPVISAFAAAWKLSPFSKLLQMKSDPQVKQFIAVSGTPLAALTDKIPGDKITAK